MINFWLQILFLAVGMACWVISQKMTFGQLRFKVKRSTDFWGSLSYLRKYKGMNSKGGPAFPGSTGLLVFVTDGYHLTQFIALRCFYAIIAISTPAFWWVFLTLWVVGSGLMWAYGEIFGRNG